MKNHRHHDLDVSLLASTTLHRDTTAALVYLLAPVALFFGVYTRLVIAIPACVVIGCAIGLALWRTEWMPRSNGLHYYVYLAAVAATTVFASGAFGGVAANSDWLKHFAIFRFLLDNPTLHGTAAGYDGGTLRYYIGWYVVPALLAKVTTARALLPLIGAWTTLGLYLFFSLASSLMDGRLWRWAFPIIFLAFSGADVIGTAITGFRFGPTYHLEWWSGWIEYSAMLTDIFWAPQHALSAWLGIALLLRAWHDRTSWLLLPLTCLALALWSPLVLLGLLPLFVAAWLRDIRLMTPTTIMASASLALLAFAIVRYLGAETTSIPFHAIWSSPCLAIMHGPCFTPSAYAIFIAIEALPISLIVHVATGWKHPVAWISTILLVTLPFVQFGMASDLCMHSSIPALAVLALMASQRLPQMSWRTKLAMALVIGTGIATPIGELRRSIATDGGPKPSATIRDIIRVNESYRAQYLVDKPIWILR